MFDACPVHPKGTMVIPMLWRISGYVVCMLVVKNQKLHIPPYPRLPKPTATQQTHSTGPKHVDMDITHHRILKERPRATLETRTPPSPPRPGPACCVMRPASRLVHRLNREPLASAVPHSPTL